MTVIELDRPEKSLRIAETATDIKDLHNLTKIYDVTHVTAGTLEGWYEIYNSKHVLISFVTGVTEVKEKW